MPELQRLEDAISELEEVVPIAETHERFPSAEYIANDKNHIYIIAREGRNLINQNSCDSPIVAGIQVNKGQYDSIVERFLSDMEMYITSINYAAIRNQENTVIRPHWGQRVIPSKALFHIARSKELPIRYSNVELFPHTSAYEIFCIPFILRLTIEVKIKSMIGFAKAEEVTKNGQKKPKDFRTSQILSALCQSKVIQTPVAFSEIKNIYEWACNFTHTGEKDFVWFRLIALSFLDTLFKRPHKMHGIKPGHNVISYIQDGKSLPDLEEELNGIFRKDSKYQITLSFDKMDEDNGIFDRDFNKHL